MTVSSEAWSDLGGGTRRAATARRARPAATASHRGTRGPHRFDPHSGWCGCGLRDDGTTAEGSPAWREALAAG